MPIAKFRNHKVYYEFANEGDGPVIVFINGLIQNTGHWAGYAQGLKQFGIRTITFDQLGQGLSDRPVLDYNFEDNPEIVATVLDACGVRKAYIAGISFGGTIVLKFGLKYPERTAGLIPMSTFSELDQRMKMMGTAMWEGLVRVGFEYLLDLFIPINFSHRFIDTVNTQLHAIRRHSFNVNDLYAIQNLIESLRNMPMSGFTAELKDIKTPTMILNAEHDILTPRWAHDVIRMNIANSRLMLIQHGYHAFSMEFPDVTMRVLKEFIHSVENGSWQGDQSVWIANENAAAEPWAFPCEGDHTRLIPILGKPAGPQPAQPATPAVKATAQPATAEKTTTKPRKPATTAPKAAAKKSATTKSATPATSLPLETAAKPARPRKKPAQ